MLSTTINIKAIDGMPRRTIQISAVYVGRSPRVSIVKDGASWLEDGRLEDAVGSIRSMTIPRSAQARAIRFLNEV